ncbi:class I SAM-dependent methyltransferase [Noviherbaspirillum saxi]|uniref:Class I SAM-dependent methyltransferase n=1 Tax=Noviherbaspirillum saxi TaxID=2320863 RepID=A0A3A3FPC0_9BURK|nr:class I SAM-dependent methyltransferase [Noviherbaspirillum saxi]RJF97310.1 class I SAM-dependent methyltransferase [Noviherbaspirillum saxi]
MRDKYKLVGPIYDWLSTVYSGKSIHRCKVAMLDRLKPGDKVLFAGVGHGMDAVHAARLGAEVTVVDLSETMLKKFQANLERENVGIRIHHLHSDIMQVQEYEQYDMVVANFFLNVFHEDRMVQVLEHLIRLGKPGADVVVGDFAFPSGNVFSRMLKTAYWYGAVLFFCLLAGNALHRIYNYPESMKKLGLQVREQKHYRLMLLDCYWSVLGKKAL